MTDPAEVERWGIVGLLHDFDYEQNPTEDRHLHVGGRILRERGYDEEMVRTIESHANYMNVPRDTPMKKAIFACDELVGFIGACVKVRPSKAIADLPVSSVLKRLKDKAFARAVSRDDVQNGADGLPRPLEEHVSFTMEALKRDRPRDRALSGALGRNWSSWRPEARNRSERAICPPKSSPPEPSAPERS